MSEENKIIDFEHHPAIRVQWALSRGYLQIFMPKEIDDFDIEIIEELTALLIRQLKRKEVATANPIEKMMKQDMEAFEKAVDRLKSN